MDPAFNGAASSHSEDDEWDADGFKIPSLTTGHPVGNRSERLEEDEPYRPPFQRVAGVTEDIYLGPHGAPPHYSRGQEVSTSAGRKQRLKQKLKMQRRKGVWQAGENKVEVLQDLMGGKSGATTTPRGAETEWLDPYCHESQFDRHRGSE